MLVLYFIIAYVIEWLMKAVEYLAKHRLGLVETARWDPRRLLSERNAVAAAAQRGAGGGAGGDR